MLRRSETIFFSKIAVLTACTCFSYVCSPAFAKVVVSRLATPMTDHSASILANPEQQKRLARASFTRNRGIPFHARDLPTLTGGCQSARPQHRLLSATESVHSALGLDNIPAPSVFRRSPERGNSRESWGKTSAMSRNASLYLGTAGLGKVRRDNVSSNRRLGDP